MERLRHIALTLLFSPILWLIDGFLLSVSNAERPETYGQFVRRLMWVPLSDDGVEKGLLWQTKQTPKPKP